jgi:hypothetical protein
MNTGGATDKMAPATKMQAVNDRRRDGQIKPGLRDILVSA